MGFLDLWKKVRETTHQVVLPAAGATDDLETPIFVAPFPCTVEKVYLVPQAAITGDTTNTVTVTIVNKGSTAATNVVLTEAFITGVNGVAFESIDMGTPVAAYKEMVAGDVLTYKRVHGSSGLATPVMVVGLIVRKKGGLQ